MNKLIQHYWDLGRYISDKTTKEDWGKGVVKELATYIKNQDPTLISYGDRNLWRMKQFYETYREAPKLSTLWSQLNWSNNRTIFSRCKTKEEQEFYLNFAYKEGWGNRELERQLKCYSIAFLILLWLKNFLEKRGYYSVRNHKRHPQKTRIFNPKRC